MNENEVILDSKFKKEDFILLNEKDEKALNCK